MSLLPTAARSRVCLRLVFVRSLATESVTPSSSDLPPLPRSKSKAHKPRLYPHPRPTVSHRHAPLPKLPPTFGRNQLLPVSNSTRALLESIVARFDAPIRYAFAYGSGVFEQDGYFESSSLTSNVSGKKVEPPMLDFMFAVTHPAHFHSINMQQHPSHYPLHARLLGSSYISKVEELGPGVWFNAYVPMNGVVRFYYPLSCCSCLRKLIHPRRRPSNMGLRRWTICALISSTGGRFTWPVECISR